ncbi:MFS general substrate transporter [Lindgomyces ingoldianus]|uniref:MFS general substrate transporter n=1 Tax=Lindgomyces ingoldianus TaxID=673940 RepID=A0ACB6QBS3_9PLEO|nr:MFS general substrate transporter [Lindgomyces ingoldianus]KAF2464048.1 MFS general substrate transporter [Lindgomyces ingoldianus]
MAAPSSQSLADAIDESKLNLPESDLKLDASSEQNIPSISENSQDSSESAFNPGWRFVAAFASLSVITLMAALDATSISVALPIMAKLLKGSAIEAFWSGTSFLLTSTVFQPVLGSFSHIFGRKPLIYLSLVLFLVGSIVAAIANNFTVILVARSIQGIGGGGIIALTEIVVTDMVPLRERGKWFSMISGMWAIGTVAGPLLGGGFSQNVSWRWIFWINLPFIGIGGIMITFFLQLNYKTSSLLSKLRRVDWIGMVLFLGSTTGFLIPITWGGVQYPWDSWRTLVPLLVSAAGLVAFVIHQEYFAPEPLIRTSVFKNTTAAVTYLETVIHGIILWSVLYYLPLYYEAVKGFSPILSGIALFPQTFTVAPAAMVVGATIASTGKYRWAIWSGWFFTTFGMGLLVLLKTDTTTVQWIFLNLVGGLGTGILFPAMAITVQAAAVSADQAYASNIFSFLRAFGQTLGVAIGGVIFQNQMKKKLLTFPLLADKAAEYSKDAAGLVQIIKSLPEGDMKHQLRVSYTDALKYIWIVMTVLAAVALAASLFTKAYSLDRALETEQGYKEKRRSKDVENEAKAEA